MTPVVFMACLCYSWPVAPWAKMGRCGWCRTVPDRLVEAPADGKAGPL